MRITTYTILRNDRSNFTTFFLVVDVIAAGNNNEFGSRDLESMKDSLRDLEADLRAQRLMKGRPPELEEMNTDQVQIAECLRNEMLHVRVLILNILAL